MPKNINHISIKVITDNDLCISCGACSHICPYKIIDMIFNKNQSKWEPFVREESICNNRCNGKELCLSVCPSYNVDYMQIANSHENKMLGKIQNVYTGYATDATIRYSSSSGGFIYPLCQSLIENGTINGIIAMTHDGGMEYTPKIINELEQMPRSVYHNTNFENALNLIKNYDGRFLLIALPCHITSIELFLNKKKNKKLKSKIYAKIALICGYLHDRANVEAFASYHAFDVKEASYRGKGRALRIRLNNDKKTIEYNTFYPKTLTQAINNRMMFDNFLPQQGCINCVDHLGYCADLVVGDAWLKKYADDKIGTSLLFSRTGLGENIIKSIKGFNFFKSSKQEIMESQGIHCALGASAEGIKDIPLKINAFIP